MDANARGEGRVRLEPQGASGARTTVPSPSRLARPRGTRGQPAGFAGASARGRETAQDAPSGTHTWRKGRLGPTWKPGHRRDASRRDGGFGTPRGRGQPSGERGRFRAHFGSARHPTVVSFLVGRSIVLEPAARGTVGPGSPPAHASSVRASSDPCAVASRHRRPSIRRRRAPPRARRRGAPTRRHRHERGRGRVRLPRALWLTVLCTASYNRPSIAEIPALAG